MKLDAEKILKSLAAAAVPFALGAIVEVNTLKAQVESLKKQNDEKIKIISEHQKEFRRETKEDLKEINKKLDKMLERVLASRR